MKKYCVFLLVPLILFLAQTSFAAECGFGTPVFERTFHRAKDVPFTEHATFSSENGKATIMLYNGGVGQNKKQRVTDATIRVNGSIVFDEMLFNKQVVYLEDQIDLFPGENDIEVFLEGKPDSKVTIRIFHEDLDAIRQFWHVVEELYATSPPPDEVVIDWFNNNVAEDFIHDAADRTDERDEWIDDPPPVGITLCPTIETPMDVTGTPYAKGYQVSIEYTEPGYSGSFLTYMVFNGTKWLWYGNREWVSEEFHASMGKTFEQDGSVNYFTGFGIGLWDHNNLAYELGARSAIVTGPGFPAEGIILFHFSTGHGPVFRLYPSGDPGLPLDDSTIQTIPDGAEYTFRLYAEDPAVVTLGDTPLHSFTKTIQKPPVLYADLVDSMFPTLITPNTHDSLEWGIGGEVEVTWINPAPPYNMQVDYMNMGLYSDIFPWWEFRQINVTPGVEIVSIDTTGFDATNQLYMHGLDEYDRRVNIAWRFIMHCRFTSEGCPLQLTNYGVIQLKDSADGSKRYDFRIQVQNSDGTTLTNKSLIQDVKVYSYPGLVEVTQTDPWALWYDPNMYVDPNGNDPPPPYLRPWGDTRGYLDLPSGQMFFRGVITDSSGNYYNQWLYYEPPTEVSKVQASSMGVTDNGDGTVTLSWTNPTELDPAKHRILMYIGSTEDNSGDGYNDVLLRPMFPTISNSYTLSAGVVSYLKGFTGLYWYVQIRHRVFNIVNPDLTTRNYDIYRNYGQTQALSLP
jgi:hypothetical protein